METPAPSHDRRPSKHQHQASSIFVLKTIILLVGKVFVYWLGTEPFVYIAEAEMVKKMASEVMAKGWGNVALGQRSCERGNPVRKPIVVPREAISAPHEANDALRGAIEPLRDQSVMD
ncbi:cytokinin hydroxylase-like [Senna tora]|uniref:Cytokinin hydroxylase-like n=1 Tax=Senna tora TaxID=362788 RepID=A0A834T472_9FABA|nr:cytokinin hydroxylase-like [Senna tora]